MGPTEPSTDLRAAQLTAERRAASFAVSTPPRPARRRAWVAALVAGALALPIAVWTFGWQPDAPPAPVARGTAFPWDRVPVAPLHADDAATPVPPVAIAAVPTPCSGDACDSVAQRRATEAAAAATAAAAAAALRPELIGAFGAVSDWTGWWGLQTDGTTAAGAPLAVVPAVAGPPPAPSAATTDDGRSE